MMKKRKATYKKFTSMMGGGKEPKFSNDEYFTAPTEAEDSEIRRILDCQNMFEVLEVSPDDDLDIKEDELRDSYLDKCELLQPNQCQHPKLDKAYEKLLEAYDTLKDPELRGEHRRKHFGLNEEEKEEQRRMAQQQAQMNQFANLLGNGFGTGIPFLPVPQQGRGQNGAMQIFGRQGGGQGTRIIVRGGDGAGLGALGGLLQMLGGNAVLMSSGAGNSPFASAQGRIANGHDDDTSTVDSNHDEGDELDEGFLSPSQRPTFGTLVSNMLRGNYQRYSSRRNNTNSNSRSTAEGGNRQSPGSNGNRMRRNNSNDIRRSHEIPPHRRQSTGNNSDLSDNDEEMNGFADFMQLLMGGNPAGFTRNLHRPARNNQPNNANRNTTRTATTGGGNQRRSANRFATQLEQLAEMGFNDTRRNTQILDVVGGNLDAAVAYLIEH